MKSRTKPAPAMQPIRKSHVQHTRKKARRAMRSFGLRFIMFSDCLHLFPTRFESLQCLKFSLTLFTFSTSPPLHVLFTR